MKSINSLLVQRGKDMGINVEADVIKQLDSSPPAEQPRQHGGSAKAVEGQGLSWDEYKPAFATTCSHRK